MVRKVAIALYILLTHIFLSTSLPIANADDEKCREFDFKKVFYFGYFPDYSAQTWTSQGVHRTITWKALNYGELNGKQIQQNFDLPQRDWLRDSFQSWDDALDSITFQEVADDAPADINVGWTQILQLDYVSWFTVGTAGNFRSKGTIEFKYRSSFLLMKENFIQAAQSDIGHVLGLGYITPSNDFISVTEWPYQAPYGQVPLGEYDVSLIRALYGESTCVSTFASKIKDKINLDAQESAASIAKAAADAKAKAEADARAREQLYWISVGKELAEAELKAKQDADAKAKAEAEARAKAAAAKKVTITCVKGKVIKKVTAINPKCPVGYTRK